MIKDHGWKEPMASQISLRITPDAMHEMEDDDLRKFLAG